MPPEPDAETPLRVGIVGTGALGRIIGRQFRALPAAILVALTDVDEGSLADAGTDLDVGPGGQFTDYATMLDAAPLDAVVITTPHVFHDEQITAALDHGLHVLCEKPMVLEVERARELADRVAGSGQVLMVGYQRHLDSSFRRVRDRYAGGDRAARFVTAEITQPWRDVFEGTWRLDHDLSGGGFLCDTGRHVVDAVLWTTGLDPVAVDAAMRFEHPGIDHTTLLRIKCASGAVVSLSLFGDAPTVRETHHVWDDDGGVSVTGRGWGRRDLTVIDDEGGDYQPTLDRDDEHTKAEAFLAAIRGTAPPPATPRDAVRATAVVEAAYESAETGERVSVDPD